MVPPERSREFPSGLGFVRFSRPTPFLPDRSACWRSSCTYARSCRTSVALRIRRSFSISVQRSVPRIPPVIHYILCCRMHSRTSGWNGRVSREFAVGGTWEQSPYRAPRCSHVRPDRAGPWLPWEPSCWRSAPLFGITPCSPRSTRSAPHCSSASSTGWCDGGRHGVTRTCLQPLSALRWRSVTISRSSRSHPRSSSSCSLPTRDARFIRARCSQRRSSSPAGFCSTPTFFTAPAASAYRRPALQTWSNSSR